MLCNIKNYWKNIILVSFAFLTAPFFYGLILIKNHRKKEKKSFLIIQTAKIGDLVCSTPVFREIKRKYPNSFLSVLVIPLTKDILKNNLYIDETIIFDEKKHQNIKSILELSKKMSQRNFDWSFSLVPGIMSSLAPFWAGIPNRTTTISKYASFSVKILSVFNNYRLEYHRDTLALRHYLNLLRFIDINYPEEKKEIYTSLAEDKKVLDFLEKKKLNPNDFLVGISVTAGKQFKEWAPEKFAQLADKIIKELKAKIIYIGNSGDREIIEYVQSLMVNQSLKMVELNLIELAAFSKKLSLFISVDTGPLYIADAVGAPVVDIAGPCAMRSQCPSGKFAIVQKPVACGPCSFIMSAPSYCKSGHLKCLKDISVEDVFQAAKNLVKGGRFLTECPICQNIDYRSLDFGGYKYKEKFYGLVKCLRCGFMFLNPKPNQDLLKTLYNDQEYFKKDYGGGAGIAYKNSFEQNKERYQEIISRLKKYKKEGTLLEVGCAGGHFLDFAKNFGYRVEGVEISNEMADFAKKNFGINVITGTVENAKLLDQSYEVVYLGDVLEHVYDLNVFLKELRRILKPNGLLYIDIPGTYNYTLLGIAIYPLVMLKCILKRKNPFSKKYFLPKQHRERYGEHHPYHLYEFTTKSIRNLLSKHDFSLMKIISFDGLPKKKNYKTIKSKMFCLLKKTSYFVTRFFNFMRIGDRIVVVATRIEKT